MKCVKRKLGRGEEEIIRVKDGEAARLVAAGEVKYCPKHSWRNYIKKKES